MIVDTNSSNKYDELSVVEYLTHETAQAVINVTTTPVELKVGADRLTARKCIMMQPRDNNIMWGFSEALQPFAIFKDQFTMLPIGDKPIWVSASSGTRVLVIAEGA